MVLSLALTILAARQAGESSVVDRLNPAAVQLGDQPADTGLPGDLGGGSLLPPPAGGTTPATEAPLVPSGD
jgi:hypothetical protein